MLLKRHPFILMLFSLAGGCASIDPVNHNLSPTLLKSHSTVQVSAYEGHDITKYQTFSVLPSAILSKSSLAADDEFQQRHLLYILRNALEGRGYRFVKLAENPDFIATVEVYISPLNKDLKTNNAPNKTTTTPKITLADKAQDNWGQYSKEMLAREARFPKGTLNDTIPQGLTRKLTSLQMNINIFNNDISSNSLSSAWRATSSGESSNPMIQVSSQLLIRSIVAKVPPSRHRYKNFTVSTGKAGFGFSIITTDGINYYPAITGIQAASPAEIAGLKAADFIIEINGNSTLNQSTAKIASLLVGAAGSDIKFKIWRSGQQINVSVKRAQRKQR